MRIKRGDYVLFYAPGKGQFLKKIEREKFSTHLGEIEFDKVIGKRYGEYIETTKKEKLYLLRPVIHDFSMNVKRTTTIIYPKDAGYMILRAGVKSGSIVFEVGTGSGAFTYILSMVVGKDGKVYTFERRKEFLENAKKNLRNFGVKNVVFIHRDVEKEGFGKKDADALFVDVPEPWKIVPWGWEALKGGASWVSLNPNVEQIKKTKESLEQVGFTRIEVVEIFLREILVRKEGTRPKERMVSHTGYILFAQKIYS